MMPLKNAFFDLAIRQAAAFAKKPLRMVRLIGQLALKLKSIDWKSVNQAGIREKFQLIGRLLRAHIKGDYRIKSLRFLILLIAAIIYFINPIDLVPDFIPGLGLVDDLAVLTWVYRAAASELIAFENWERNACASVDVTKNGFQPLSV